MIPGVDDLLDEFPEYAIAAAVLRVALAEALSGDEDARDFLLGPRSHGWLWVLLPKKVEQEAMQERIVGMLDRKVEVTAD